MIEENILSYGANIHIYLVSAFGSLFALSSFLLSFGLRRVSPFCPRVTRWTAVAWIMLAPIFFVIHKLPFSIHH